MTDDMGRDGHEREARFSKRLLDAHDAALVVEAVEERCEVIGIARDALRRVVLGCALDFLGVLLDFLDEIDFRSVCQEIELRLFAELQSRLARLAEDALDARMSVLDVVDRVVVRLLLREVRSGPCACSS